MFEKDDKFKILEFKNNDEELKAAKRKLKKKKGLTEKDLDFEQEFDDDQEEDVIPAEDEEAEEEEENLSEDGRKMKKTLKDEEEAMPVRPMNLEFTIEQGDKEEEEEPRQEEEEEEEKDDESDSSMASIFGEDDQESVRSEPVGQKRTFGQSNGGSTEPAKKRQKFF